MCLFAAITGIAMFVGHTAVSLSSFGGEGQGEEGVALDMPPSTAQNTESAANELPPHAIGGGYRFERMNRPLGARTAGWLRA